MVEVLETPLSVTDSRPAATPFPLYHALYVYSPTDLVVVVRCGPCRLVAVCSSSTRCRTLSRSLQKPVSCVEPTSPPVLSCLLRDLASSYTPLDGGNGHIIRLKRGRLPVVRKSWHFRALRVDGVCIDAPVRQSSSCALYR